MTAFKWGVASGDPVGDSVVLWTRIEHASGPVKCRITRMDTGQLQKSADGLIAHEDRDWTVHWEVCGLEPGIDYCYQFEYQGETSPLGIARVFLGELRSLSLCIVDCINYAPNRRPRPLKSIFCHDGSKPDLIVSIGDYIYETAFGPTLPGDSQDLDRDVSFYRARYADLRSMSEAQQAHASAPWLAVWDDHDIQNDCWSDGAPNCEATLSYWNKAKQAALQAFYEWMPMREPRTREHGWRVLDFGSLATLVLLETRLSARSNPTTSEPKRLIGDDQFEVVSKALTCSQTNEHRWRIVASGVPMAKRYDDDVAPNGDDGWDNYRGQRAKFLGMLASIPTKPHVFSGDLHAPWMATLKLGDTTAALEFGIPPICSELTETNNISYPYQTDWMPRNQVENFHGFVIVKYEEQSAIITYYSAETVDNSADQYIAKPVRNYRILKNGTFSLGP